MLYVVQEFVLFNHKFLLLITLTHMKGSEYFGVFLVRRLIFLLCKGYRLTIKKKRKKNNKILSQDSLLPFLNRSNQE